jgi:hypothetical protein
MANIPSDKILARLKGLRAQMRAGEQPLFSIPAIWENATDHRSNACDLVLTNQRLFGYIYTTFPRERLFLDALELNAITAVSIRQKNFSAMFRELLVSDNKKRIYIRATGKKIEETYTALRAAIADYIPATPAASALDGLPASVPDQQDVLHDAALSDITSQSEASQVHEVASTIGQSEASQVHDASSSQAKQTSQPGTQNPPPSSSPIFSRQRIRQPLERSPLGITILLTGGLILEVIGILAWIATDSPQTGGSLILAGLLAVIVATIARRQLR